jgi:hypothetical protein
MMSPLVKTGERMLVPRFPALVVLCLPLQLPTALRNTATIDQERVMKTAFTDEFEKIAVAGGVTFLPGLVEKIARPNEDFAVSSKKSNTGKPAYPIPDKKHAISALGFAKMHHDKSDLAEVRKDVASKYPDLVHKEARAAIVAVTKFAEPKKGKEKDSSGMGMMGPSSAAPPGMMGGPPPGSAMKATMQAGM